MTAKREQSSSDSGGDRLSRRPFIKATSAGLLGAGLAGCSSSSNQGGNNNGNQTTKRSDGEKELSGLEFDFWDRKYYFESKTAQNTIQKLVKNFESNTGATVNLNLQSDQQPFLDALKKNRYPPGFLAGSGAAVNVIKAGKLREWSSYQDKFEYDVMKQAGSIQNALKFSYSQWPADNYLLPISTNTFAPFVARRDLYKQAGLDPEKDFPPESYDDLVRISTTLAEKSNAQEGYQPYGSTADMVDVYGNVWTSALGGAKGYELSEDWSEVIVDNDVWTKTFDRIVSLYQKHGQGTAQTPTISDETTINLMLAGRVAMSQQAPMNMPVFRSRAPQMVKSGNLMWGPAWKGETGINARPLVEGGMLTKKPPGADKAKWDKKQKGVIQLLSYLNSIDVQVNQLTNMGFFPVRQDAWPKIPNDAVGGDWVPTLKKTTKNAKYMYQAYGIGDLRTAYESPVQKAFKGEISVDEALKRGKNAAQDLLESNMAWKDV